MVRLPGPDDIARVGVARDPGASASPDDFGAQIGAAQMRAGQALQNVGQIGLQLAEERQNAEDKVFLDTFDLEHSRAANQTFLDAQTQAPQGGAGFTSTVDAALETGVDPIIDQLVQTKGFRPSQRAIDLARSIAIQRRADYGVSAQTWEHNQRIAALGGQYDDTISRLEQEAYTSGDAEGALERLYQSSDAYQGVLPADDLQTSTIAAEERIVTSAINGLIEAGRIEEAEALTAKFFGGRPAPQGDSAAEFVVDRIIQAESSGNPNAVNPRSSASGLGQFINSTWLDMVKRHRPDVAEGKTDAELIALKTDPSLSRQMTVAYATENASTLQSAGFEATPGNIYLAHFAGPEGALKVLRANPGASVASVLGQSVVDANPHLKGMNAGGLRSWAANKMGGYDGEVVMPNVDMAIKGYAAIDTARNQQAVETRGQIEVAVENAPVAIQNTGEYTDWTPDANDFLKAYGAEDGARRYNEFQSVVEASEIAHGMRTMPTSEVIATVERARPTSTGDDAALQQQTYQTIVQAAEQTIKAREADPAGYTQAAFPNVATAWRNANTPQGYQRALATTAAAQEQLGVPMVLLPKQMADSAVTSFQDGDMPEQDRVSAVTGLILGTSDVGQRRAIFDQLVEAGLPEITEGAFEALTRGDEGAARRLFLAAMVDPSSLPGSLPNGVTPARISEEIQSQLMDVGSVGDLYYGLSDGTAENFVRAQRDQQLMENAVKLRLRNGESLNDAVSGVAKDIYGEVKVVNGNWGVNARLLLPTDANAGQVLRGLEATLPAVRNALVESLTPAENVPIGEASAVIDAATENYINNVMAEGYFRNSEDGYVFIDPFVGEAVSDADGQPIIFTEGQITEAIQTIEEDEEGFMERMEQQRDDFQLGQPLQVSP